MSASVNSLPVDDFQSWLIKARWIGIVFPVQRYNARISSKLETHALDSVEEGTILAGLN